MRTSLELLGSRRTEIVAEWEAAAHASAAPLVDRSALFDWITELADSGGTPVGPLAETLAPEGLLAEYALLRPAIMHTLGDDAPVDQVDRAVTEAVTQLRNTDDPQHDLRNSISIIRLIVSALRISDLDRARLLDIILRAVDRIERLTVRPEAVASDEDVVDRLEQELEIDRAQVRRRAAREA